MRQQSVDELAKDGFCCLKSVFGEDEVTTFRDLILQNRSTMAQTRNSSRSYHLAGFHRFPAFSQLHTELAAHPDINGFLTAFFDQSPYVAIGLSDITINRSQQWHTDLLRGPYGHHLDTVNPWAPSVQPCIKALVYLQPGKSLRIVRGSHLSATPLDDAELDQLAQSQTIEQLELATGDVVMMDLRALHRGSTDAEMENAALGDTAKILISTVFAPIASPLSQAMQIGNAHRMADWDRRHLGGL